MLSSSLTHVRGFLEMTESIFISSKQHKPVSVYISNDTDLLSIKEPCLTNKAHIFVKVRVCKMFKNNHKLLLNMYNILYVHYFENDLNWFTRRNITFPVAFFPYCKQSAFNCLLFVSSVWLLDWLMKVLVFAGMW